MLQICKIFPVSVFLKRKGRHGIVINTQQQLADIFYFINGEVLNSKDVDFFSSMYAVHVL